VDREIVKERSWKSPLPTAMVGNYSLQKFLDQPLTADLHVQSSFLASYPFPSGILVPAEDGVFRLKTKIAQLPEPTLGAKSYQDLCNLSYHSMQFAQHNFK